DSLGYSSVFWTTVNLQAAAFAAFAVITFLVLYGAFIALKPARIGELTGGTILINGQPVRLPVGPVLNLIGLGGSLLIAAVTGASMMAEWPTLALYWYAPASAAAPVDPILGRSIGFYLFTLPAWQLITGWLLTLAVGAAIALVNAVTAPRVRWLIASVVPAAACFLVVSVAAWYVNSFIVKPNELVRERPYIAHNIELTRRAYALDRVTERPFPA